MARVACVLLLTLWCFDSVLCWFISTGDKILLHGMKSEYSKITRRQRISCPVMRYQVCPAHSRLQPSWSVSSVTRKLSKTDSSQVKTDPRLFFNHDAEIAELRTIFYGAPKFTVVLGPPSTGKTRLVNRVLSSLKADGTPEFHALNINLRGVALNNGNQFWEHLVRKSRFASVADKAWALFAEAASMIRSLQLSAAGLEVDMQESNIPLKYNLDSLSAAVPVWNGGTDIPFVLVIDEANALKSLAEKDISVRCYRKLWTGSLD
jgi:hypothetical protein